MTTRRINVEALARVEGEGRLDLVIRDGVVERAELAIFEPPRFFEALLRGRRSDEAPDITARICGICPVAYQMSAVHALERAAGAEIGGPIRDLRRLLYCGEWIESHALHVFMLHAPDFLGFDDAVAMARDHRAVVENGLAIKKAGNAIVRLVGGREIHPINVRVGGFYRAFARAEMEALRPTLEQGRDAALAALDWLGALPFPDYERDYAFVALRHDAEYPMNDGRLISNRGLDAPAERFFDHVRERQDPRSTALRADLDGHGAYLVGPLARFNLNRDRLTPLARAAAAQLGLGEGCRNPFQSILVRGIEILLAFETALDLLDGYAEPDAPYVAVEPASAAGCAVTEAPRGLLAHRYRIDADGRIEEAQITPPTSQNQSAIEADLLSVAQRFASAPDDELQWRCEQTVRNYDPCISCATHFLRLEKRAAP